MSETPRLPRPRQVTVAGGLALVSCALLVVALLQAMSQVRSVETRDMFREMLSRPPGSGLGVGVDQLVSALHVLVLLDGAVTAVAAVLAVFVLQRHNGARIGFTVSAAFLLFTAPFSNPVLPVLVAIAATMLWSPPARAWFAGRPAAAPAGRDEARAASLSAWQSPSRPLLDEQRPPEDASRPDSSQPGPAPYPFGSRPQESAPPGPPAAQDQGGYPPPASWGYPTGYAPSGYGAPPDRRPGTVTAAAWLTWIFSGLTVVTFVLVLVVMVAARGRFVEALRSDPQVSDLNLSANDIMAGLWVLGVVVLLWCLISMVLAFLAWRRVGWARVTLAVSAGVAAVISLIAFPVGLLSAVAAVVTVVLLFTGGANEWYRGAGTTTGGYGSWPPGPPSYPGPSSYPAPRPEDRAEDEKPPKNVW